jgi:hypothetical protein
LSWSSDLDGALGTGSTREVTLSEGTHTITLDVSGGVASATTTVVVEVPPPLPERFYTYLPLVLRQCYGTLMFDTGHSNGGIVARRSGYCWVTNDLAYAGLPTYPQGSVALDTSSLPDRSQVYVQGTPELKTVFGSTLTFDHVADLGNRVSHSGVGEWHIGL